MLNQWAPAIVFMGLAAAMAFGMLAASWVLRVRARRDAPSKHTTYECGEEPDGGAWISFHPRYYLVALVFVLFDVEMMFLFPWALSLRTLGLVALVEMVLFVAILLLGWVYALKKGALKWS